MSTSDVIVVVRSCGERTTDACVASLRRFVDTDAVFTVREIPFSASVVKGFHVALEQRRPWLLCIDADVLPTARGISALLAAGPTLSEDTFEVQGLVHDKFFNVTRPAGNHLYRTALVEKALRLIPPEGTSLKPESDMLREFAQRGYPYAQSTVVVGVHDFEQYYRDVFRTNFLQARKHRAHLDYLVGYWTTRAEQDPDFRVALCALEAGLRHAGTMLVDQRSTSALAETEIAKLGLAEKPPLAATPDVDAILRDARDGLSPAQQTASAVHQERLHEIVFAASAAIEKRGRFENWLRRRVPPALLDTWRRLRQNLTPVPRRERRTER